MSSKTRDRIVTGDRARIHPANGADAYEVTITDLGAWGMTAHLGARLIFVPWAAVDLVERVRAVEAEATPPAPATPAPVWCLASIDTGDGFEGCDLVVGHEGPHLGMSTGRRFGSAK